MTIPGDSRLRYEESSNASSRARPTSTWTNLFHFNALYHLPSFTDSKGLVGKA